MIEKWEADECRVYMGDGGISLHNVPNGTARAQLIAAAPDVLDALGDCIAVLTNPIVGTIHGDDPDWYAALDLAVMKARAAITKATGNPT